jgi:DNA-binding response OmpR family regulator
MGFTILVADDDPDIVRLVSRVAVSRGHKVLEASDGAQAMGLALAEKPDAITLDIMMPRLDGRDVISRLKKDPATARAAIIILTAVEDAYTRELCFEYGADDYILKPFDVNNLFLKIERAVAKAKAAATKG